MLFEPSRGADRRQLRQFAAALIVFVTAAVALRWRRLGYVSAPVTVAAIAGYILGVAGLIAPRTINWLYVALSAITRPIGLVLSEVMLLVLYFGVVTPMAVLSRLTGRDRLNRRLVRGGKSYWVARRPASGMSRYFRQS